MRSSFLFNDTPTTEIYTLSLHDALPICAAAEHQPAAGGEHRSPVGRSAIRVRPDALACVRSEEHTSELQSQSNLVCRLLLEKKKIRVQLVDCASRRNRTLTTP